MRCRGMDDPFARAIPSWRSPAQWSRSRNEHMMPRARSRIRSPYDDRRSS